MSTYNVQRTRPYREGKGKGPTYPEGDGVGIVAVGRGDLHQLIIVKEAHGGPQA